MFVPLWVLFLTFGTLVAITALVWGIRNHQFEDQERARYLPLGDLSPEDIAAQPPARASATLFGVLAIFATVAFIMALTVAAVLRHTH